MASASYSSRSITSSISSFQVHRDLWDLDPRLLPWSLSPFLVVPAFPHSPASARNHFPQRSQETPFPFVHPLNSDAVSQLSASFTSRPGAAHCFRQLTAWGELELDFLILSPGACPTFHFLLIGLFSHRSLWLFQASAILPTFLHCQLMTPSANIDKAGSQRGFAMCRVLGTLCV